MSRATQPLYVNQINDSDEFPSVRDNTWKVSFFVNNMSFFSIRFTFREHCDFFPLLIFYPLYFWIYFFAGYWVLLILMANKCRGVDWLHYIRMKTPDVSGELCRERHGKLRKALKKGNKKLIMPTKFIPNVLWNGRQLLKNWNGKKKIITVAFLGPSNFHPRFPSRKLGMTSLEWANAAERGRCYTSTSSWKISRTSKCKEARQCQYKLIPVGKCAVWVD